MTKEATLNAVTKALRESLPEARKLGAYGEIFWERARDRVLSAVLGPDCPGGPWGAAVIRCYPNRGR